MKLFKFVFTILLFSSYSVAQTSGTPNFSEPPFWLFSYEEFTDMQANQKKLYLRELMPLLKKVPEFKKIKESSVASWSANKTDWEEMMDKVYKHCSQKSAPKYCEKMADIRLKAINMEANQSEENRKAEVEAEKK